MDSQLFGTIETLEGSAKSMLCVDADLPNQVTLQWINDATNAGYAIVCDGVWTGDEVELKPKTLHRLNTNGAIQPAARLSADEFNWVSNSSVNLARTADGLSGNWNGPGGASGAITLSRPPEYPDLVVDRCSSWADFKAWADRARAVGNPVWFRGHGSSTFPLRTTLHRLGRCRLERYCYAELPRFHVQAEAVLNRRFDLNNAFDYATVVGLARHHGMPTPLLDWTASPYIAAFFAFSDALDLRRTLSISDYVRIYGVSNDFVQAVASPMIVLPWVKPYVATLTIGPLHNPRLAAQQGHFLVTNVGDVETYLRTSEMKTGTKVLSAVDVPALETTEALKDLAFMGLTAATLFPGLDGVARMIRHEMSYDSPP